MAPVVAPREAAVGVVLALAEAAECAWREGVEEARRARRGGGWQRRK